METGLGVVLPVGIGALFQLFIVTLFIFRLGPVTGAHLTPLLTFATFLAKLTSLPRMILYIISQCVGAVTGAYIALHWEGIHKILSFRRAAVSIHLSSRQLKLLLSKQWDPSLSSSSPSVLVSIRAIKVLSVLRLVPSSLVFHQRLRCLQAALRCPVIMD